MPTSRRRIFVYELIMSRERAAAMFITRPRDVIFISMLHSSAAAERGDAESDAAADITSAADDADEERHAECAAAMPERRIRR